MDYLPIYFSAHVGYVNYRTVSYSYRIVPEIRYNEMYECIRLLQRPNCLELSEWWSAWSDTFTDSFRRLVKTRLFSEIYNSTYSAVYALYKFTTSLLTCLLLKWGDWKCETRFHAKLAAFNI